MTGRLNHFKLSSEQAAKLFAFSAAVSHSEIEPLLRDLVSLRASQMNGCVFCVDMHSKEAKLHGARELQLYHLAVWRESPLFTPRERAALAWTESLTALTPHGISDEAYAGAREVFSEKELSDLTFAVAAINTWNRLGVAFRPTPGGADKQFGLDKAGLN